VDAEIISADVFEPSVQDVEAIKKFAPKVIVGWFWGSNADDQEKYVSAEVQFNERPKKYRENMEDAMLTDCPRWPLQIPPLLATQIPPPLSRT
jgi:hypothetical protein